jgi:hypothetical protein
MSAGDDDSFYHGISHEGRGHKGKGGRHTLDIEGRALADVGIEGSRSKAGRD